MSKHHTNLRTLYTHSGTSTITSPPDTGDNKNVGPQARVRFPRPSIFKRAHLKGILYSPSDMIFVIHLVITWMWVLFRLHFIELPFHILTLFRYSSKQHPASWPWWSSVFFALVRAGAIKCQTMGQIRLSALVVTLVMPLQLLLTRNVKVNKDVKFKVKLDILLLPERETLRDLRDKLQQQGHLDDPFHPSTEYLESMHPRGPNALANLPEEVGEIDPDGTFTLQCEWIEVLEDPDIPDPRPTSKTVILYFHGGAFVFNSTASHRHMLAHLAKDVGPGTRVLSVGYRLAPENPFPAAIHDAYAAYLYLTEPDHAALILDEGSAADELAVDPRDIVVAGDSGGGNVAVAFMQYMIKYVQPSTIPKFVLPHATLLLSPWIDVTSMLPEARKVDWYCYSPGPIGTSPFDKKLYLQSKRASPPNCTSLYVCGDAKYAPNIRNAFGTDRRWEWYSHLVQHPLVSFVSSRGSLNGMTNTLIQSASHDRMRDDSRLIAHRVGLENSDRLTRIEVYKDMVHVHQYMFFLFESACVASRNLARFIERSYHQHGEDEHKVAIEQGHESGTDPERSYASVLRRPFRDQQHPAGEEYEPALPSPTMVNEKWEKSLTDGVEWVLVEQDGREVAGDEGPLLTELDWAYYRGGYEKEE